MYLDFPVILHTSQSLEQSFDQAVNIIDFFLRLYDRVCYNATVTNWKTRPTTKGNVFASTLFGQHDPFACSFIHQRFRTVTAMALDRSIIHSLSCYICCLDATVAFERLTKREKLYAHFMAR